MAPTVRTITTFFKVQILSHFLIPYLLLSRPDPVLRKGAQICNIGRPGENNQDIDMDDFLCLKALESGKFNLWKDTMKFVFMVDLFTQAGVSYDLNPTPNDRLYLSGIQYEIPRYAHRPCFPWFGRNEQLQASVRPMVHSSLGISDTGSGTLNSSIRRRCYLADGKR
jgi:hypothetical protein